MRWGVCRSWLCLWLLWSSSMMVMVMMPSSSFLFVFVVLIESK